MVIDLTDRPQVQYKRPADVTEEPIVHEDKALSQQDDEVM